MFISLLKNISIKACTRSTLLLRNRPAIPYASHIFNTVNTDSSESGNQNKINITQACVDRLKQISAEEEFLRVTVDGGGCSGFQYRFDLDSELKDDDVSFDQDGAKVVVDKISLDFLKGATVDYKEELIRSAFRVIDIPLAASKCSCGTSFAIKMP